MFCTAGMYTVWKKKQKNNRLLKDRELEKKSHNMPPRCRSFSGVRLLNRRNLLGGRNVGTNFMESCGLEALITKVVSEFLVGGWRGKGKGCTVQIRCWRWCWRWWRWLYPGVCRVRFIKFSSAGSVGVQVQSSTQKLGSYSCCSSIIITLDNQIAFFEKSLVIRLVFVVVNIPPTFRVILSSYSRHLCHSPPTPPLLSSC